jgi:DNA-binding CsgD family transcriptional regulator
MSAAVVARRLDEAERWAGPAIQYCLDCDLDTWRLYIEGYVALTALYRGRFSEALAVADRVLAVKSVPAVSRITPLVVRGLALARAGEGVAAPAMLEATRIAESSGEVQRLDLTACALTELSWLEGGEPPDALQSAFERSPRPGSPWRLGDMATWLARFDRLEAVPGDVASPYQLELTGRPVDAAEAWAALGSPYDEALARGRSDDVEQLTRAVRALNDLGATPAAARVGARLAELGGPVPRPRRRATRTHPAGLTEREAEVLELLATGATNSTIATELGISARTAEHHVSSVLTKLAAPTRSEAVSKAIDRGWIGRVQPR